MTGTTLDVRTAALMDEVRRLEDAVVRCDARIPIDVRERVATLLAGVHERLELGVDHTVVALVGGTGSGKSSLFNALTGLDFADVGVRRPTTSTVAACVWAHDASALLDWLGVGRDRRIERESALDGESQADLRGLVLLDLPDHDSIEAAHREVVDELLPHVDLICWVVDPQKYADDALHSGYLRHLAGHEAAMLVVLNQIDTVPPHMRGELVADVGRLVVSDGLDHVRTLAVSAATGDSMDTLRSVLAHTVAGRGVAEVRAAAELADAADVLRSAVGPGEPDLPVELAVGALLEAAGVPGQAAAVGQGAPPASEPSLAAPTLGPVQADRAALVREAWLEQVGAGLPASWVHAVDGAVADDASLVSAVDAALGELAVPLPPPRGGVRWLGPVGAVGAIGAMVSGVVGAFPAPWWWAAAGALTVVALVTPLWEARTRRSAAREAGAELLAAGSRAVAAVVEAALAGPTREVLADHKVLREAVVSASALSTVRGAGGSPTG